MRTIWLRSLVVLASAPILLVSLGTAAAQGPTLTAGLDVISSSSLPDAPLPQSAPPSPNGQSSSVDGAAALSGIVLDATGAAIPGAQVSLTRGDGWQTRRLTSGSQGEFSFTRLPAGSYLIIINARGFAPFTSSQIDLGPQQVYQVSDLTLSVGSVGTEVTVRPTEVIAAEQIKAEEKQRFIGVLPNFYTSYVHDPAPMTTKQKFSLATHDSFDPVSLIADGVVAGVQQANGTYPGYGYGAAGYGKRFAAQFGDGRTSDFLSHAVFPALFHQDPRYFYQGTGSINLG